MRFGPLTFRGGLSLTSSHPEFGGISSIRVQADGASFIAVSDKGRWIRGRIVYDGTRPAGIADAEIAPVLGPDGRTLSSRGWYDTESIAQDGGTVWLGIERVNRIVRFDIGKHGLLARGQPVAVPPGIQRLPNNKGLECLDFVPRRLPLGGSLIAISERGLDADGNIQGFLLGGPSPGEFSVKRIGEFDVSDCAVTPTGDLLVLERSYSRLTGVGMRIRRIPLAEREARRDGRWPRRWSRPTWASRSSARARRRRRGAPTGLPCCRSDSPCRPRSAPGRRRSRPASIRERHAADAHADAREAREAALQHQQIALRRDRAIAHVEVADALDREFAGARTADAESP